LPLNGPILKEKVKDIASKIGYSNFEASKAGYQDFAKGIVFTLNLFMVNQDLFVIILQTNG